MITTLIICLTVIFCVTWLTVWATFMALRQLPMFTFGECIQKEPVVEDEPNPIGFSDTEAPKEKTPKEEKESLMSDPITMTAALLRGEVDIDDII